MGQDLLPFVVLVFSVMSVLVAIFDSVWRLYDWFLYLRPVSDVSRVPIPSI